MARFGHQNASPVTRSISATLAAVFTLLPAVGSAGPADDAAAAPITVLAIDSDPPGARLYIDGQFAGETPINIGKLSAGEHRIRLVKDGYLENARIVSVNAKQPNAVQVKLTRATGAAADAAATQVTGGSSGGSSKKKWIIIGAAAGGGAAVTALALANRNKAPTVSGVTATPNQGLAASTSVGFSAQANDSDGDTLTFSWEFGDGATDNTNNRTPTHIYASAGTFQVGVDVSDGKATTEGSTTVTIRSMAGPWSGTFGGFNFTMNLTQSGATIGGSYSDADGPGTVAGTVSAGNAVRITVTQAPFLPFTFAGTTDTAVATVSGQVTGLAGAAVTFTMRR